jgi:1,4-dihydroxy-2-naphthoate polyprenyltransferase
VSRTPGPVRRWVLAARARTLPAAIVPVVVGALSVRPAAMSVTRTVGAAVVALALQVGTNYANDFSDGIKGTDENRVGPFRLTASGLVHKNLVRSMAFAWFVLAAIVGVWLAFATTLWLVPIGVSAVLAGWFYTGGPKPYGYFGFGELFVMIYFGFVATVGTAYLQNQHVPSRTWWLALMCGSMACAMLESNNLRDVAGDIEAGKKTLAARLGRRRASWLYVACVLGVAIGAGGALKFGFLFGLLYLVPLHRLVFTNFQGRALLPLLQITSHIQLAIGAGIAVVLLAQ